MSEYHSIKDDVLTKLAAELPTLQEKFGIATIGIFGSVSRGEDTEESDVDVLVSFAPGKETYDAFFELAESLEELFGRRVELIFAEWIHPGMKPYILKDAIYCEGRTA